MASYLARMKPVSQLLLALFLLAVSHTAGATETQHDFSVWAADISAFEGTDATNPPPPGGIEFVGSSTIARWKTLTEDFAGQPVFNRGFGGSEIVDVTHYAHRIIFPYAPRKIFFRAGGNDLSAGKSPEQVAADFQDFVTVVHAQLPATEIYYISWCPTPLRWYQHEAEKRLNTLIAAYIRGKSYLKYIETYDLPLNASGNPRADLFGGDHLHFNNTGYRLLTARVMPFVVEPLPRQATNTLAK